MVLQWEGKTGQEEMILGLDTKGWIEKLLEKDVTGIFVMLLLNKACMFKNLFSEDALCCLLCYQRWE